MNEAYIVETLRTPGGRRKGAASHWHPADMAAEVINALLDKTGIDPAAVDDVILGCVTQAGEQSNAFARNAVLSSRLPQSVPGVTIDRQCGSSQQSIHFAAQSVMSGVQDMVIAGGGESMTRVPMFSNRKLHDEAGLGEGPYSRRVLERYGVDGFSQFTGAEMMAGKYGFSREDLDNFALMSHRKAAAASRSGAFDAEMVPLTDSEGTHTRDEGIRFDASLKALADLKPLVEDGVITAGNASQICDGASGLLIVGERALRDHGLTPIARIAGMTVTAGDPVIMLDEPINATRRAMDQAGMNLDQIDLYEVNEAFAPVPMAWLQQLDADPDRLNVNGGSIALGHPLGATGAKLTATLIHALRSRGKRYGLQTMCEAGGIANVTIFEAL
ncbi:acetyl-CoA C-acetyltransferase [Croceicoccus sp. YJ47]|uniref:acetyl-CoA C-acetyltransferase n=1 Tax=Croceicoccus sp. YJ47 TaxID=2798724 RepID=UPI0019213A62|nr:acetyl-CoA C-acetyltransferase [Croceicoccus sp. YJ47]QQN75588.1 acetyl-CoA C-acetyltransferase [Croceicoccus sp. YJ47]